ncbi:MAG TPA: hypothetical protein VG898_09870 [Solirubrobacterales bacterium]|nr:hypothetical protein [Solirubrobacterales bacterium]
MALLVASAAAAATPRPLDLRVGGGEESWHSRQPFSLSWRNPGPVVAVHYRLRGPAGETVIDDTRLPWATTVIEHLSVSPRPGVYTVEVWLEDGGGLGEVARASLRFDDARPGDVAVAAPPGWLGRASFPFVLRLGHPGGAQPLSGIGGYAVAVDRSYRGHPCPDGRCGAAELETHGGIGADTVVLPDLPEGLSYLHAVAVSGSGMASATAGHAAVRVDEGYPRTVLEGVPEGWRNAPVRLTARAADGASGMSPGGPGVQPYTAIRIDGGAPVIAAGDSVSTTVIASGVHTVAYYARDAAGNADDGGTANGHPNPLPATALVRIDREPPRVAFAVAQDPADPERLEARATDSGAGLDPARGTIEVRRAGAGERYRPLPTEVVAGALRARWDSSSYPAGEYEFRVVAYDRAGNSAVGTARGDGRAMRLRGPLKLPVKLTATSGRRAVRYGRGVWFGGRLLSGRHTPLSGVAVRVIEGFSAGAAPAQRVTTVRSDGDGRFGLRLAAGPSRQVSAQAVPTATSRGASSRPLTISVHSRVVLRASARVARIGGPPIVLRGRIAHEGVPLAADGKLVQLQFRLPGLPWREFRTVRSNRAGRFRYAYRFSDDDSRGARFQFRAYAAAQAGWPFEPAGSLPVVVRGV